MEWAFAHGWVTRLWPRLVCDCVAYNRKVISKFAFRLPAGRTASVRVLCEAKRDVRVIRMQFTWSVHVARESVQEKDFRAKLLTTSSNVVAIRDYSSECNAIVYMENWWRVMGRRTARLLIDRSISITFGKEYQSKLCNNNLHVGYKHIDLSYPLDRFGSRNNPLPITCCDSTPRVGNIDQCAAIMQIDFAVLN